MTLTMTGRSSPCVLQPLHMDRHNGHDLGAPPLGHHDLIEVQLRALREEVEGISRKLGGRPAHSEEELLFGSEEGHGSRPGLGEDFLESSGSNVWQGGGGDRSPWGARGRRPAREEGSSPSSTNNHMDAVNVSAWILEAGTLAGQVARAQRALQDMASERDAAVFRHREAVRTAEALRVKVGELSKIKDLYIKLQQEYGVLQTSFESSERIRIQQKELIQTLKATGGLLTEERNSQKGAGGGGRRSLQSGAPDITSAHDFFLNYSQNLQSSETPLADSSSQAVHASSSSKAVAARNTQSRRVSSLNTSASAAIGASRSSIAASARPKTATTHRPPLTTPAAKSWHPGGGVSAWQAGRPLPSSRKSTGPSSVAAARTTRSTALNSSTSSSITGRRSGAVSSRRATSTSSKQAASTARPLGISSSASAAFFGGKPSSSLQAASRVPMGNRPATAAGGSRPASTRVVAAAAGMEGRAPGPSSSFLGRSKSVQTRW